MKHNRREFLKKTLLAGCTGVMVPLTQSAFSAIKRCQAAGQRPPNILYVMADDQRFDTLGCMGNLVINTPNLDLLAEHGTCFTHAFVTTPICCVSRANVLTGQYARRHGVNDFFTQIKDIRNTYPGILKGNSYYIGFIGKWGTDERNEEYFRKVSNFFDFWGGSMGQSNYWHERNCHFVLNNGTTDRMDFSCDCPPDEQGIAGEGIRVGRKNIKIPIHESIDVIPHKVEQFLDQRDPCKPFCLSVSLKAPHGPWEDFADEVSHLFSGVEMPISASVNVADAETRPDFLKNSLMNSQRGAKLVRDTDLNGMLQKEIRKYYRLIAGIDICIGKIISELKKRGLDENTIIIYTSDNGHFLGEHGFDGKWLLYEESIRVPLIIYDPRNPKKRQRCGELALLIDMAPTILDLAGVKIPADMQGKSLLPQVASPGLPLRDSFFMEHLYGHGNDAPNHIERSEGVRTRRWKYINYIDQSDMLAEELYDLKNDPLEMHNLSRNSKYKEQKEKMRNQWLTFQKQLE